MAGFLGEQRPEPQAAESDLLSPLRSTEVVTVVPDLILCPRIPVSVRIIPFLAFYFETFQACRKSRKNTEATTVARHRGPPPLPFRLVALARARVWLCWDVGVSCRHDAPLSLSYGIRDQRAWMASLETRVLTQLGARPRFRDVTRAGPQSCLVAAADPELSLAGTVRSRWGSVQGHTALGDLGTLGLPEGLRQDRLPSWADGSSVDLDPTARTLPSADPSRTSCLRTSSLLHPA